MMKRLLIVLAVAAMFGVRAAAPAAGQEKEKLIDEKARNAHTGDPVFHGHRSAHEETKCQGHQILFCKRFPAVLLTLQIFE